MNTSSLLRCLMAIALLSSSTAASAAMGSLEAPLPSVPPAQGVSTSAIPANVLDQIHFRSIGPTKQGGRIMDLGVPDLAKQPFTFYAAASTGGLWKTADNGLTWKPIFDHENINSIGDIAVAHSDPNILWVGTGNASYWGEGMYKSTDGGESWLHMGLEDSLYISRILVHPDNPDVVYAAAVGDWGTDDPSKGIFKTINGGTTWTKSLAVTHDGYHVGAADIVMDPRDPNVLYASSWDRNSGAGSGIYKTTDGGNTWTKLTGGLPTGSMDRIGLDIYQSNTDTVVASILTPSPDGEGYNRFSNAVWRTDDAGGTWRRISPPDAGLKGSSRFGQIRIDPNDDHRIYVLNTGVQGTFDGGQTWGRAIRFGGDNQAMWINPDNSDHMLLGYDYGLAISFTGGHTWYHPDNLPLGQLEAVGVDMAYPYNVYGGMQDFGTWRGPSTSRSRFPIRFEAWEHVRGADGSYAQVDPSDNRWMYVESQNGSISRNDQKTGVRKNIRYRGNPDARFNFIAPILISPHNSNVIFHGANMLLRSEFRGEDWQEISPDLSLGGEAAEGRRGNGTITTIAESPLVAGLIWAGTDSGNVQLTQNGGENWARLNDNLPDSPVTKVSQVEASHHNPATAYVSFSGGRRDRHDLKPYVYKTTDYGATWAKIVNGLPEDEPVNVIREDHTNPNLLFIGTAKAIYVSLDGGVSWTSLRNNMPNVPIHDMVIHPRENDLVVATYGRSFWIADISVLQELTPDVIAKQEHLFKIESQVLWISSRGTQVAAAFHNYDGENAPHGVIVNYYLSEPAVDEVTVQIYRGSWLVNEYSGSGNGGLNSVQWYLTERIPRTEEEKVQWDRSFERAQTEEEYFDYYDGTDHFGEPGEEVSIFGRSLEIWIHTLPEWRERDYKHIRAQPGEYIVKVLVNGHELTGTTVVLQDHWYDKRY